MLNEYAMAHSPMQRAWGHDFSAWRNDISD
jgi:hypothetical protein